METYKSNYKGEESAFGIAAIGNVANDTINLFRLWFQGENTTIPSFYEEKQKRKQQNRLLLVGGGILIFILIFK